MVIANPAKIDLLFMRGVSAIACGFILVGLAFSWEEAFGCSCLPPPPAIKGARELAEWRTRGVSAIFEGTVEDLAIKSPLLEAPAGKFVSASLEQTTPIMLVSFRVSRWYRGGHQETVQIETGLGGGDCGFPFEPSGQYLVYADKSESGRLSTGICTGTALLEESEANLAYLRGEAVVPDNPHSLPKAGSRVCVRIIKGGSSHSGDETDDRLWLYRVGHKSPIPSEELQAEKKGNYCSTNIGDGDYYLAFTEIVEDSPVSFLFYPGVTDASQAQTIIVGSGQSSDITFSIPYQQTFSVSGAVTTLHASHPPKGVKVILINADQGLVPLPYLQDVGPDGTFTLARVLPGRYWAFAGFESDSEGPESSKWLTRKTELIVDGNVSAVSLTLMRN